jgi:penicillin-binding protein 1A
VTTADGHVLWNDQPTHNRVLSPTDVTQMDYALHQVVLHGTGTGADVAGHDIAGKTGTTSNYNDAWFVGYAPSLTTAVWMGYPQSESERMSNDRGGPVTGGSLPATIFQRFMSQALSGTDSGKFPTLYSFAGGLITGIAAYYSPTTTGTSPSRSSSGSTTTTAAGGGGSGRSGSTTTTSPTASTSTTEPKSTTTTASHGVP